MAWLALARMLVRAVRFGRWRTWLGRRISPPERMPAAALGATLPARQVARAVDRGAARLPGDSRCLPQAMAVHWMLRRRGLGSLLLVGVRPGARRGNPDDLHAWVIHADDVVIGGDGERFAPLAAFEWIEPGGSSSARLRGV